MNFNKLEDWLRQIASQGPAIEIELVKIGSIPFRWKVKLKKGPTLVSKQEVEVERELEVKEITAQFSGDFIPEERLIIKEHVYSKGTRLGVIHGPAIESHHHSVILRDKFIKIAWLHPGGAIAKGKRLAVVQVLSK